MVRFQFQLQVLHLTSQLILWSFTCGAILALASTLPIAKPNCQSSCGRIEIPYPFGIGAGCYLISGPNVSWDYYSFRIVCDNSTSPPRPFLSNTGLEVLEISIDEYTLHVNSPITFSNCSKKPNNRQAPNLDDYPFWYTQKNRFTSMSCGGIALMTSEYDGSKTTLGGCLSICDSSNDIMAKNNSCGGINCCQTTIPFGLDNFNASFGAVGDAGTQMNCKSAFLVDQDWFTSNSTNISTINDREEFVPVVLGWYVSSGYSNIDIYGPTNWTDDHNSTYISDDQNLFCSNGFHGNPYLIGGCQDINECEDKPYRCRSGNCINKRGGFECQFLEVQSKRPVKVGVIVTSTTIGLLTLLVGGWWSYKVIKKRKNIKRKQKFFKQNGGLLLEQQLSSGEVSVEKIKVFNSKELEKATDHFNVDRILGQGGQGTVYKGMLEDGRIVAVKKSKIVGGGNQEVRQFINEIVILSQIIHRNVVKLLGCCLETEVPLLVYEFIANGTLSEYIHQHNEEFPLTWEMTLRVAIEVAGALSYLHSAAIFPIYHRDIKSSNILLDDKYRAKVADFGTSRSVSIDQTHLTTLVHGTFGYLDPEYLQSSQFTEKSDVYSFGVVLAELLTGEKPVSVTRSQEGRSLSTYFLLSMEQNRLFDILDVRVMKDGGKEEIMKVANLAKRCLNLNGRKRPTMKEVAAELEGIQLSVNTSNHAHQNLANVAYAQPLEINEAWDVISTSTGPCTEGGSSSCDAQPLLTVKTIRNYLNWSLQFMLSLSAAARVCNELGVGHPKVAKFSVFDVTGTRILISIVFTAIILIFQVGLSKLFSTDPEVIEAVIELTPLLAISVFLNGIQPILSGVAIGSGWQHVVAYVNLICFYIIGLPIGYVLGFKTNMGVAGIWWGMIVGVVLQTITLIILTARTNWNDEVVKAVDRLKRFASEENLNLVGYI